jgi:hypothetical protein
MVDRVDNKFPPLAAPYCDNYRYFVDGNNIVTIWLKQNETCHVAVAMHLSLLASIHEKVTLSAAEVAKRVEEQNKRKTVVELTKAPQTEGAQIKPWPSKEK